MYRRHPATRVPSRNRRRRAHPTTTPPAPHTVWVVEDGEVIHRQGLGSESITAWIGPRRRPLRLGKSANRLNSQRAGRSSRRLSRGSTRDVYRPARAHHQRGRDRLRSRSDRHQRRRAPADARARPLDAGGRRRGRGRPGDRPRRARERRAVRPGYLATRPDACRRGGRMMHVITSTFTLGLAHSLIPDLRFRVYVHPATDVRGAQRPDRRKPRT